MKSKFRLDLSKEILLGQYLDTIYHQKFKDANRSFHRVNNLEDQLLGIDLSVKIKGKEYLIDEKAQLDYLNKSLPTFAFEISFLKNKKIRIGWLFDQHKKTDVYFLVTNIRAFDKNNLDLGFKDCSITAIHRVNLQKLLAEKGLDEKRIFKYESLIRKSKKHGKHSIKELHSKQEGFFYFSYNNKKEQPINLVLYLKFLTINNNVGKKIR